MSLVADVLEIVGPKPRRKKPAKIGAAPLVPGKRNKHALTPPVKGKKALLSTYGLEQIKEAELIIGTHLLHVVRSQANVRGSTSTHYRPAFHPCTIVKLTPNRVVVRFSTGAEKAVRLDSLFKAKEKSNE